MKPMLLCKDMPSLEQLRYPVYVTPKLDGIRCIINDQGIPKTRTLKDIPNKFIRSNLSFFSFRGLDGEIIVGDPTDVDVFNKTTSAVRREEGEPDFKYYVFDMWDQPEVRYGARMAELEYFCADLSPDIIFLKTHIADSAEEILALEAKYVGMGYEGVILRSPSGLYKYGRTTLKEDNAWKMKRFVDSEAVVIGMVPEMHNANEATVNELGRTKRSTHKENLIAKESMGALLARDLESGVEFSIGTGFTAAQRQWWYYHWQEVTDPIVYKYFPVGVVEKPRHPVFKGIRMKSDV